MNPEIQSRLNASKAQGMFFIRELGEMTRIKAGYCNTFARFSSSTRMPKDF
jgi:hypothetical protein